MESCHHGQWGLYGDYRLDRRGSKARGGRTESITSLDDASAESRVREIRLPGSTWRRPKRSDGVASEAPSTERDGNSWAFLNTTAPVPDPTVELIETDFSVLGSEAG